MLYGGFRSSVARRSAHWQWLPGKKRSACFVAGSVKVSWNRGLVAKMIARKWSPAKILRFSTKMIGHFGKMIGCSSENSTHQNDRNGRFNLPKWSARKWSAGSNSQVLGGQNDRSFWWLITVPAVRFTRLPVVSDLIPRFWGRNIFFGMLIFIMLGWTWYLVCVGSNCCVYDPLLHISILRIISTHFMEKCTVHTHSRLPTSLKAGQGKNTTFYFTGSSRCFCLNKSVLETKETKQTDSLLCFAPKNIKIHLVVLENELFEVAWVVSKTSQKQKPTSHTHIDIITIRKHP